MEAAMGTTYDTDVAAWANEQAALLREGRVTEIDTLNIAEEIEDVAESERRELGSEIVLLVGHLLKWKFQPSRRGKSWAATIRAQRSAIRYALRKMPSLKPVLQDEEWLDMLWQDALALAQQQTDLDLPADWIWPVSQVLDDSFWPD
jgi:hypothetical protein